MAKIKTQWKCDCGQLQTLTFKKPSYFSPTRLSVTCDLCNSNFDMRITKPKNDNSGKVLISHKKLDGVK